MNTEPQISQKTFDRAAAEAAYVKAIFDGLKNQLPQCSDDALLNSAAQISVGWDVTASLDGIESNSRGLTN